MGSPPRRAGPFKTVKRLNSIFRHLKHDVAQATDDSHSKYPPQYIHRPEKQANTVPTQYHSGAAANM